MENFNNVAEDFWQALGSPEVHVARDGVEINTNRKRIEFVNGPVTYTVLIEFFAEIMTTIDFKGTGVHVGLVDRVLFDFFTKSEFSSVEQIASFVCEVLDMMGADALARNHWLALGNCAALIYARRVVGYAETTSSPKKRSSASASRTVTHCR